MQDFESERKWKLAQAKKVSIRASKGMLDQATRGEKKMKVLCLISLSFHTVLPLQGKVSEGSLFFQFL